jgi:manganese/zinc/iron transport system permease protein
LFGQAAAIIERDVLTISILGVMAIAITLVFWKEFKLLSFDPEYAASLGLPVRVLDVVLTTLLVVAIVIGLQAVGVILMSAMVVAPAAAARQWTNRLGLMIFLAALFGAVSGIGGAVISSAAAGLGTGPVIVLFISGLVLLSMLFASNRGLVWNWLRQRRNRRRLRRETILSDLYLLSQQHQEQEHGHSIQVLQAMAGRGGVEHTLKTLLAQGLVQRYDDDAWFLTPAGVTEAERLIGEHQSGQSIQSEAA